MNIEDVRRCLKRHGAAMEYIVIIPRGANLPGWQREGKYNVIEVNDGYIVSSRDRGKNVGERHFTDLDAACRYVAPESRQVAKAMQQHHDRVARARGDLGRPAVDE